MKELLSGAMVAMYLLTGLFFLRFWRRTRDALFAYFAVAFWILGAQHLALALTDETFEHQDWFYSARLVAFLLILVAVWNKNRAPR